jgi:phosphoglycolate phosphatase
MTEPDESTPTRSRIALAIFDLDGTLIDSVGDLHAAMNRVLAEQGATPLAVAEIRAMVGDGAGMLVERALQARPEAGLTVADGLARFLSHYEADPVGLTRPYPGVPATLALLQRRGIRLALCTNKPERPSRTILEHCGLAGRFERIVGGDSLPWRKPDGRVLTTLIGALGAAAETSILIGDSEVDAAAAAASGIRFILMTYGYRRGPAEAIRAHAALDRFEQLADVLG